MVMLAEDYEYVIGGDPDRDTIDLAVVDTATGGVRGHIADTADGPGYLRLLDWTVTPRTRAAGVGVGGNRELRRGPGRRPRPGR